MSVGPALASIQTGVTANGMEMAMHDEKSPTERTEAKLPNKDITPVLKGWDYEPGTINVRKVSGLDGSMKLQMRLDLGLLQMELTGRPDGVRPHGFESLLEYFESLLKAHERQHGAELGFQLNGDQCEALREEAVMYYHRYLSLFVLEDFPGVVRDTARNLRVLDLCGKYAEEEQDRLILEQYRPYILMMNTRAAASILFKDGRYREALGVVEEGLEHMKEFFRSLWTRTGVWARGRGEDAQAIRPRHPQEASAGPVGPAARAIGQGGQEGELRAGRETAR